MLENWYLIAREGSEKNFELSDIPKSKQHEEQIPFFKKYIESENIEIFKIEGHQFITENGIYMIANESELTK
jgi:hypothetical protein